MSTLQPPPGSGSPSADRQPPTGFPLAVLVAVLGAFVLLRLLTLGAYVLADTSEPRYAEVARLMLAGGDWIVPLWEAGVPYWGKPPLFAWAGAASMAVFGVDEFAVRLPSWVMGVAALGLTFAWARSRALGAGEAAGLEASAARRLAQGHGWMAATVLATCLLFFVVSGAVLTEPGLLLGTLLMNVGFWAAVVRPGPGPGAGQSLHRTGWLFFVGIGLGLLAKGPVVAVFGGLPVLAWFAWTALRRPEWGGLAGVARSVWARLPWVRGLLLALALAAPWYAAMEWRNPGFLHYYLIGEHITRFLDPGWEGNRFGTTHHERVGAIWLGALVAALPWSPLLLAAVAHRAWLACRPGPGPRRFGAFAPLPETPAGAVMRANQRDADTRLYLACVVVLPLGFFTLTTNVIWLYAVHSLPAMALLLAPLLHRALAQGGPLALRRPAVAAMVALLAGYGWMFTVWMDARSDDRSTALAIAAWQQAGAERPGPLVVVHDEMPHSAHWYSQGRARFAADLADAMALPDPVAYLLTERAAPPSPEQVARLEDLGLHGRWRLWRRADAAAPQNFPSRSVAP